MKTREKRRLAAIFKDEKCNNYFNKCGVSERNAEAIVNRDFNIDLCINTA